VIDHFAGSFLIGRDPGIDVSISYASLTTTPVGNSGVENVRAS